MKSLWRIVLVPVASLVVVATAAGIVAAQTGGETPTPTAPAGTATDEDETPTDESGTATSPAPTETPAGEDEEATPGTPSTGDEEQNAADLKDQFLDRLAQELGISRDQLEGALRTTSLALLDQAVADGVITEEEAARIREEIQSGERLFFFGQRHHGRGYCAGGVVLDDVAQFLGVDEAAVRDALEGGQSLAQVAEANGKSRDELRSFLVGQVQQRLGEKVADGDITQERADELLAEFSDRVDELIDREGLPAPARFRFREGPAAPEGGAGAPDETAITI